jgi:hypothetical protein
MGDLQKQIVCGGHIVAGVFFVFLGYHITQNKPVPAYAAILVSILGGAAILFHAHTWISS